MLKPLTVWITTKWKITWLSDFTFTFHFHALEKEMATHSSVLAWRIPGTRGAWWAAICGVAQSRTRLKRLSSSSSSSSVYILEKAVETHSSTLAWRIPGTGEPGRLPSVGSHRVRHDWSDIAAATAVYIYINAIFSICPTLSLHHCVHKFILSESPFFPCK